MAEKDMQPPQVDIHSMNSVLFLINLEITVDLLCIIFIQNFMFCHLINRELTSRFLSSTTT